MAPTEFIELGKVLVVKSYSLGVSSNVSIDTEGAGEINADDKGDKSDQQPHDDGELPSQ